MPPLSENFLAGFKTLSTPQSYNTFIDNFGTHYISQLQMGAKYGFTYQMQSSAWSKLNYQSISVSAAASASYFGVTATVSSTTTVTST